MKALLPTSAPTACRRWTVCAAWVLSACLALPVWAGAPFTVNGNGTVSDATTGLVWDQCAYGRSGATCTTGTALWASWPQALAAAAAANAVGYKGFSDWRVPNVTELESIAKLDSYDPAFHIPSIDREAFPNPPRMGDPIDIGIRPDDATWTSTTYVSDPNAAWVVNYGVGIEFRFKSSGNFVRLVRSGQSLASFDSLSAPSPSGTVSDATTGLVWDQCPYGLSGSTCTIGTALLATWQQALAAAVAANAAGYKGFSDWRVPNKNELDSIVKLDAYIAGQPMIDTRAFPNTPFTGDSYGDGATWTSTTYAPYPNYAWFVGFRFGDILAHDKTYINYVRLVRSGQSLASFDPLSLQNNGGTSVPIVNLNPASLSFGDQNVGTTSPAQTVTMNNSGSAALTIASITPTVNVFAVTHNCGGALAASGSCSLNVTFAPAAVGTRLGAISVTSNAAGSPHSVIVSGVGTNTHASCTSFTINPSAASPTSAAGSQPVTITGSPSGCQGGGWNAWGNGSWLTVSPTSGSGSASVTASWTQNTTGSLRIGSATIASNAFTVNQSSTALPGIPANADLSGDGRSDILWRNSGTGQLYGMLMNGNAVSSSALFYTEPDTAWKIVGVADFDGDGKADLLWRNDVNGMVYVMLMDGTSIKSGRVVHQETDLAWKIVGTGDFNGDGKADILWRNDVTGQVFEMQMNGTTVVSGSVIHREQDLAWKIVAVADFDDDGKDDILWRNDSTGQVYVMLMNGNAIKSGAIVHREVDLAWKIVGTGDFNGDGMADILWRHDNTGQVFEMQMNGTAVTGGAMIHTEPDPAWKIVAVGDYNGDAKADILWWNESTGWVVEMQMNGFSKVSAQSIYHEANTNWKILGPLQYATQGGAR